MSQLTASTISAGAGDTGATVFTNHEANGILLQKNFIDTADPGSPPNGQEWIRSDDNKKYCQIGGAKTEVLWRYVLNATLNAQSNQITNLISESLATGSLPTPGAGTKGRHWFDSTLSLAGYTTAAANFYSSGFNAAATSYMAIPCSLNVAGVGQAATASTATRRGGWLLDATADELNWVAEAGIPDGWTEANDFLLEVSFLLAAAETNGDDYAIRTIWITTTPGSGEDTAKTATTSATITTDIGTASGQFDAHKARIVIDHDHADNTVAVGDYLSGYVSLTSIAEVTAIIVTSMTLLVPCFRPTHA